MNVVNATDICGTRQLDTTSAPQDVPISEHHEEAQAMSTSQATSYTTTFAGAGSDDTTDEDITATFEYCEDFNNDGFADIRVTLSLTDASNSGTEDIIGVAFDIQGDAVAGLQVTNILRSTTNGTLSTFTPATVIGANSVSDGGPLDPGFSTSGGGSAEPYDVGIKVSDQGSGEGIVQAFSFVLTTSGADLDAEALLENTDWWVRLQSTDGGDGSAKTTGNVVDLPPCVEEPPPEEYCFEGLTPGFWKQPQHFGFWPAGYVPATLANGGTSYEATFGLDVIPGLTWSVPSGRTVSQANDISLLTALDLGGGGQNPLARHASAALLNAETFGDGMADGTGYRFSVAEIKEAVLYAYNLQDGYQAGDGYVAARGSALAGILDYWNNAGRLDEEEGICIEVPDGTEDVGLIALIDGATDPFKPLPIPVDTLLVA